MNAKNFDQKYYETKELCNTPTDGGPNVDTTLWDWMQAGYWTEMTPEQMAAEWDSLSID